MPHETPPDDFVAVVLLRHIFGGFRLGRTAVAGTQTSPHAREETITPDEAMQVAEFMGPETIEFVRLAVEADRQRAAEQYEGAQKRQREADESVVQAYGRLTDAERAVARLCPPDEPQREETT